MSAALRVQRAVALFLIVLATTVALMATTAVIAPDANAASDRKIRHAMRVAKNQIGDRYAYGADGPRRFDCSGLTYFSYRKRTGLNLPRTSSAQYRAMRPVIKKHMRKGDLMFFHSGGGIYHVGMFVGWNHGKRIVLHWPSSGHRVHRQPVWTGRWKAATLRPRG